jgi:hypothetical protein
VTLVRRLGLALVSALLASSAAAQGAAPSVHMQAQVNATRVQVGDTFQLDVLITIEGSGEPEELVQPDMSDFEVVGSERAPTSQRTQIVNGQMSSSRSFGFVYFLRADSPGQKKIGPGRVRVGKAVGRSQPLTVDVIARGTSPSGGRSSTLDPVARFSGKEVPPYFVDARFDRDEAWLGQQLLFTVQIYATEYVDLDLRGLEPPKPSGFWVEVLETPARIRPTQRTLGGRRYLVYELSRVAMFPLEEGEHTIEPIKVGITTTRGAWRRRHEVRLESDPVTVLVKPLPKEGRPPDFDGNVGVWKLKAEVPSGRVPEGQPVTLKLRVGGEGNLNGLTLPTLSDIPGARVFPPTTSETKGVSGGRLHGEKTVELLVQPLAPGKLPIPSVSLSFFNPETAKYETARTQPIVLDVTPAKAGAGSSSGARSVRVDGARPVARGLTTSVAAPPLYRSPGWLGGVGGVAFLGLVGFGLGLLRTRGQVSADAAARRARRDRRQRLDAAREARDVAAAERVVLDALADRFGEEVRALPADALERELGVELGERDAQSLKKIVVWLDAAQQSRYAPAGGADKRGLFDDAGALLDALAGEG